MNSKLLLLLLVAVLCIATGFTNAESAVAEPVLNSAEDRMNRPWNYEEMEEKEPIVPLETLTEVPSPSVPHPNALLLMEQNCKIRTQWPKFRSFIIDNLAYYPTVHSKIVSGNPRLRFFEDIKDMENNTIEPERFTVDEMVELLKKLKEDPTYFSAKKSVVEVAIPQEATPEQIEQLLAKFSVAKGAEYDPKKRPMLYEEIQERNRLYGSPAIEYSIDEVLGEFQAKTGEKAPTEKLDKTVESIPIGSKLAAEAAAAPKDEL